MKFSVSTILFAGAGIFFSAVANAAAVDPTKFTFPLRAWVNPRNKLVPPISHYVEIDMAGNAVINKTDGYRGFMSYIDPTPERGTLHTLTGENGYLFPVTETSPRHYQLKYSKVIPRTAGVLYSNFTTVGRDCGGNCGGASLDYGHGDGKVKGEWYIISGPAKAESGPSRKIWALRWIAVEKQFDVPEYPTAAIPVFLWKN